MIVDSVSVVCADAATNPANANSYVYGTNTSSFTPAIDVTNETTVNGAGRSLQVGLAGASGMWTAVVAGAAMALGAILV